LSGVVHAIRSNIESNSIRSLSLIQPVEVKSGTAMADPDRFRNGKCLCGKPDDIRVVEGDGISSGFRAWPATRSAETIYDGRDYLGSRPRLHVQRAIDSEAAALRRWIALLLSILRQQFTVCQAIKSLQRMGVLPVIRVGSNRGGLTREIT
jgi:hypothetical protein